MIEPDYFTEIVRDLNKRLDLDEDIEAQGFRDEEEAENERADFQRDEQDIREMDAGSALGQR